ncbi:acyl carrier protein, partial [Streptomyces sp. NPDC049577]|uniref:acyl carrier protein n=1 Tax=Streptomyces sp. NPDC049577 TaxID=3155153 RepID=UPI00343853BE
DRLAEFLRKDREVLAAGGADPAAAAPPAARAVPEELRRTVAEVAASVLATDPGPLLAGTPLTDVPAFSSFRIVEIVERLESELGVEFAPDDLVPENLHEIDAICRVVNRPPSAGTAPAYALPAETR